MNSFDILVKGMFSFQDLRRILAAATGLPQEQVGVFPDYPESNLWDSLKIMCLVDEKGGDFKTRLHAFSVDQNFHFNDYAIIKKICQVSGFDCLTGDDTLNPYSWILVSPTLPDRKVFLRTVEMENDEYYIDE